MLPPGLLPSHWLWNN